MSVANAAPAEVPAISTPCTIAPHTAKSRKPRTGGKPGTTPGAPPNEAVKMAISTNGKNRAGNHAWGRRTVVTMDRHASAAVWRTAGEAVVTPGPSRRPRGAARCT